MSIHIAQFSRLCPNFKCSFIVPFLVVIPPHLHDCNWIIRLYLFLSRSSYDFGIGCRQNGLVAPLTLLAGEPYWHLNILCRLVCCSMNIKWIYLDRSEEARRAPCCIKGSQSQSVNAGLVQKVWCQQIIFNLRHNYLAVLVLLTLLSHLCLQYNCCF